MSGNIWKRNWKHKSKDSAIVLIRPKKRRVKEEESKIVLIRRIKTLHINITICKRKVLLFLFDRKNKSKLPYSDNKGRWEEMKK